MKKLTRYERKLFESELKQYNKSLYHAAMRTEAFVPTPALDALRKNVPIDKKTYSAHFVHHGDKIGSMIDKIREEGNTIAKQHGYKRAILHDKAVTAYTAWKKNSVNEDAPANFAGGGAIAAIGVGDDGEPGVMPKAMAKYKNINKKNGPKAGRKINTLFMKGNNYV